MKKIETKPTGPPPPIYADCYEDLPPDVQKILKEEKISPDLTNKNWQIMVYILKFRLRRHIHKREDLVSMPIAVKHKVHVDLNNLDSGDIESLFNKLVNGEPLDDNEIGGFAGMPMEAAQGNQPNSGPAYVPFWNLSRWVDTRGNATTTTTTTHVLSIGTFLLSSVTLYSNHLSLNVSSLHLNSCQCLFGSSSQSIHSLSHLISFVYFTCCCCCCNS